MKRLAGFGIMALLFIGIFPLLPAAASEPATWSKPRPTTDRPFEDSVGNTSISSDGQATLALGVGINKYVTNKGPVCDALRFTVDLSASTREGITYDWVYHGHDYSWVTVNQPVGISGDDSYALVNLGFPVLFYGINYSNLYVFSNGFVSFTSPTYASTSPVSLPSTNINATAIAPFWRKLKLSQGGSIKTGYIGNWPGDPPHNYKVFTWDSIPDINGHLQTFQLLIEDREQTGWNLAYHNRIFFQYLSVTNDVSTTIGVQDRVGYHGNTYPLNQITNHSVGGFTTYGVYGLGYRITQLRFAISKVGSDSNAKMDLQPTYEGGDNVKIDTSGNNSEYAQIFSTAIEGGVNALLDRKPLKVLAKVIGGLFILWDVAVAIAGADYEPVSGTLTSAGFSDMEATGLADTWNSSPESGEYNDYPFDASFGNLVYWSFKDTWPSVLPHSVRVTAEATYMNAYSEGGVMSTSVSLEMYPGPHYVDVSSGIVARGSGVPLSGVDCWVDGQISSTPISELILPEGYHNITVPASIMLGSTLCTFNAWAGPDGGGSSINQYLDTFTADKNITAEYLILGDIVQDGSIDIYDCITLASAFNSHPGSPNWNPYCDLNKDGTVDIFDAIILAGNFGKSANTLSGDAGFKSQASYSRKMLLGGTSVSVSPSEVSVFKNEVFSVSINVGSLADLLGWEFQLYWNSTVLNCTNAAVQSPIEWQGYTQDYGTGIENSFDATHGRFFRAQTAAYPAPSFGGSMTIVTLTFQAIHTGTTSLMLTDTKLGNSTAQPIDFYASDGSVTVYDGRYMRSDTATINGLNGYLLNATETGSSTYVQKLGQGFGVTFGIRAWLRASNGTEYEVTLDGQTGTPKATVTSTGWGTVNITQKSMQTTYSLVIRVYVKIAGGAWTNFAVFTTEQLGTTSLIGTTWSVYYHVSVSYSVQFDRTTARFYWGDASHMSRVQNLQFS